jgi:branched-chain amino acid transport system substrate-binding protein
MSVIKFIKSLILLIVLTNYSCHAKQFGNDLIKIAVVAPTSGPNAIYGKELLFAANQAIVDANLTNKLEILPFDDQSNPEIAKSIATQIVTNKRIKAIIGHLDSNTNMVASKIYAKYNLLQIIPTATSPLITQQGILSLFRMCGKNDIQAQNISDFLIQKFVNQKIAILHSQDFYSTELVQYVQESLAAKNKHPDLYQSIAIPDFQQLKKIKPILKKLKKLNIDVIFFAGLSPEAAALVKAMYREQINIPLVTTDSIATSGFIKSVNPTNAAGTIMSFHAIETDNTKQLTTTQPIYGQGLLGYAAMQVIHQAIEYNQNNPHQTLNGLNLSNWLHQNKVTTVLGDYCWDTNGDVMDAKFAMYIWDEHGKYWPINN